MGSFDDVWAEISIAKMTEVLAEIWERNTTFTDNDIGMLTSMVLLDVTY